MLKDIDYPHFDGVGIAAVYEQIDDLEPNWYVYLLNFNNDTIYGVLVSSKGYGEIDGEQRKSSTLRHFLDEVEPLSFVRIEPIPDDLFVLDNEYWLSFYHDKKLYDRKFIFKADSIALEKAHTINLINKKGILIM